MRRSPRHVLAIVAVGQVTEGVARKIFVRILSILAVFLTRLAGSGCYLYCYVGSLSSIESAIAQAQGLHMCLLERFLSTLHCTPTAFNGKEGRSDLCPRHGSNESKM